MDEAKLKQLAEQYTEEYYFETPVQFFMAGAYIATREAKEENRKLEKENQLLKDRIEALEDRGDMQNEEITRLDEQIEKMKLCMNCVNQIKREYEEPCYSCHNRSKWSLKK